MMDAGPIKIDAEIRARRDRQREVDWNKFRDDLAYDIYVQWSTRQPSARSATCGCFAAAKASSQERTNEDNHGKDRRYQD